MASIVEGRSRRARWRSSRRVMRRRALLWLLVPALAIVAGSVVLYARAHTSAAPAPASSVAVQVGTTPSLFADRFMQSILIDDGALGWRQLCPSIQAALPMDQLTQQANAAGAAAAQQGIRLTAQFVGAQPRVGGGEQRLYLVTAHWSSGATQRRAFAILTQASGCVEDASYQ